ncbi:trk system potassium uptake protein TrkH [Thermoactinomyces sp. DSM 45891]|uniref:TrkH family potassium uptake protein n=1 Tax=Thermoactinomyces sp. DSM 45891 TaxID=1761907 RepID=UPI0009211E01|nr:TrkH family potassium uptake protein [Thermoactinomyces sp. DSM 45891]SFX54766.1 trk system potassium uptake protein TrkH [Thermoactinomyces sp. DSM 45891]
MNQKRKYWSPPRILVAGFFLIIFMGSFLLTLPLATKDGQGLAWIDSLFTATSATCVTGLVVVDTGDTFTLFGQMVILILILVGGLGFMTFATFFAVLLGKRVSFQDRLLLQEALNKSSVEGIVSLVKRIVLFAFIIQAIGAILLTIRFVSDMPLDRALYFGIFHSISNFNNAGFDIMGSFQGFTGYVSDPYVSIILCTLIFLGGIGFIVLNELYEYRQTKRISLHSKMVLVVSIALILIGTIFLFLFEYTNPKTLQPLSGTGKVVSSFYQAITPRTAGSNTLNIPDLTQSSILLMIVLMFIGASPGSTGGGIKTSTFSVLLGAVKSQIKGKEDVTFYRRRIPYDLIYRSLAVASCGFAIVVGVAMLLTITEKGNDFLMILFEATSAFGTVGLSMGLTPNLSIAGKMIIIFTMFAGRVGILTIAFALAQNRKRDPYRYPEGNIMIG